MIGFSDVYEKVYGKIRYRTHFPSSESLTSDIRSDSGSYLACCDYLNALKTRFSLAEIYGEDNIHTSYISESENMACFLLTSSATMPQDLTLNSMSNIHLRYYDFFDNSLFFSHIAPIPHNLKIHPSAMHHLGLVSNRELRLTLSEHYKMESNTPLEEFTLIVSTGIGVPGKRSADAVAIHERILHKIHNNRPMDSLKRLNSINSKNSLNVRGDVSCNFRDLSFQVNNESGVIYVTNLHSIVVLPSAVPSDSAACYAELLATLVLDSETLDIRMRGGFHTFNQRGKSIIQSNTISTLSYPYHAAGLTGEGQIIGVGDTGVDELSCFFQNSDLSFVERSSYRNPKYDLTKRVVVQYINYADSSDVILGHGTHVCGTIAGSTTTTVNYNGHGVGAKIAFFDMSINGDSIFYPPPLSKNVFSPAYTAGARLHSNSWGSNSNIYDDSCTDIDSYHVTKSDFLAIFAAGNSVLYLLHSLLSIM